jgi:hypothetical protein
MPRWFLCPVFYGRYVSGEKEMKEGDQGTRRAGEAKEKEKEPKIKLQKKCGSKKKRKDLKKKTLSRNRSPTPSNALIRRPSKVSNKSCKLKRQRCSCPKNRA